MYISFSPPNISLMRRKLQLEIRANSVSLSFKGVFGVPDWIELNRIKFDELNWIVLITLTCLL